MKTASKTDCFLQRGQSWFVASDIPSDLLVQIGDVSFHVHKYPLVSRSGKMNRAVYESGIVKLTNVLLHDLPGGPEAFGLAARFCYGVAVDLTVTNISSLRCAAEYLEMTEDFEEGNLVFKTEAFLSYVVLSSWRDSIVVLKSCESLSPWAENLQIVRRCSESIAWKACVDPKGIKWQYTRKSPNHKWMEMNELSPSRVPVDWWFEDVSILRVDHFVRVITAIKVKGMSHELIGDVIMHYATKWLHGHLMAGSTIVAGPAIDDGDDSAAQAKDQRQIVESLITIIPSQKDSVSCSFLLKLVRISGFLKVAPALVTELEKRIGSQLDQASLSDLIIPCCSNQSDDWYDVDLVQRLVEHFLLEQSESRCSSPGSRSSFPETARVSMNPNAKMRVARLVDSYLTEVSGDRNLSLTKFQVLAEALPGYARISDDGLYRAVDSYLKAHPNLTEHERKRLCRVLDCQKLSIEACMHIAQNDRLPLRIVVQVLFAELVKVTNSLTNSALNDGGGGELQYQRLITNRKTLLEETPASFQEEWATAKSDIYTLKFGLETMRKKYFEMQNELETLQRQVGNKPTSKQKWNIGWLRKITKAPENGGGAVNVEQTKKAAPRRWRHSVS